MEKDTRPVRCFICKKKMYYSGHPKHEPEYRINDYRTSGHVHKRCIDDLKITAKALRKKSQKPSYKTGTVEE